MAKRSLVLVIAAFACGGGQTQAEAPAPTQSALPAPPPPQASASAPPPAASTAEVATEPVASTDSTSQSTITIDRDSWATMFESALPVALCKSGSYFTACFTVTPVECEQTAASATRVCLAKVRKQLPAKLHQPDDGRAWGSKIGSCAGIAYEAALANKKIHNAKCDDPNAWNGP